MPDQLIMGNDLLENLCKGLNLPPNRVRRIVLDVSVNAAVTAYVEILGDEALLNIKWDIPEGAEVKFME